MASKETNIIIPSPNIQSLKIRINGTAPLIFHKWSEKMIKMIEDKQQKRASKAKEARNPEEEYKNTYYRNSKGEISFPANSIKQAMVGSCRFISGIPMTLIRGAVFVEGDADGLIKVNYESEGMRTDMVKIAMATADVRYRGELKNWYMDLIISFNADILSAEQVINLLSIAGFSQGLGEWRPEKSGSYGTFTVVNK